MKKLCILSFLLVGFMSTTYAQGFFGWEGCTAGAVNYIVYTAAIDSSELLPDTIVYTVALRKSPTVDSILYRKMVIKNNRLVSDTLGNLPTGYNFDLTVKISDTTGYANTYTCPSYTSWPAGITEQSANAPNIWNAGTTMIHYANVPEHSMVVIKNIIGQVVTSSELSDQAGQVAANDLRPGIYLATISKDEQVVTTRKIVIN